MRILHLCASPVFSGPLPTTLGLALAQRDLGHQVWLAYDTKRGGAGSAHEEPAAARVDPHRLSTKLTLHLCTKSTLPELWRDTKRLRLLAHDVDVLHVHTSHDHTLAVLSGVASRLPTVRTFHAARSLEPRLGQRWLSRRADGWVVRSAEHAARLVAMVRADDDDVLIAPGGIDAAAFAPAPIEVRTHARRKLKLPADARVLLHVALIEGRGQEELAGALVRVNSDKLHVLYVGEGSQRPALELLTKSIGLEGKVHFTGYLGAEGLALAYAAADAAFLAQPGNDASARAALEAMACELPVIAVTTDPALRELVSDEVGFPVADRAPAAIADALAKWLDDPLSFERGRRARRFVLKERSFTLEAERTLGLYAKLLRR